MRAIQFTDYNGLIGNFWRIEDGDGEELITFAAPLDVTDEAGALALYEDMLAPPMADLAAIKADLKRAVDT